MNIPQFQKPGISFGRIIGKLRHIGFPQNDHTVPAHVRITGASSRAILSASARLPAVVCRPFTSILSFTSTGIPASSLPCLSVSCVLACSAAVSSSSAMQFSLFFPPMLLARTSAFLSDSYRIPQACRISIMPGILPVSCSVSLPVPRQSYQALPP